MENNFTPEQIEKAKAAKSPEELLSLAKESGVEITEEQANVLFEKLNKSGELNDDELDNVASGGCFGGPPSNAVGINDYCDNWRCRKCGKDRAAAGEKHYHGLEAHRPKCYFCKHSYYDNRYSVNCCNHPSKKP